MVWDTWRRLKDPALRRPMKKGAFFFFWSIGYAGSSFIEREVAGTLWGPFLIGAFGALALWFIPVAFMSSPSDES